MARAVGLALAGPWLVVVALLIFQASYATAFGAGNIASISKIEGHNWRHGDIEDMLKTVAFIKGHKWTSMMVKRVYFGNWLRDYSQAVDVGTLKGIQSGTLRILVWVLSFLSFGYATAEFEVTEERLGTYRPEEHIDNPKDYADNIDARQYDPRLRPPVQPVELEVDPQTGMKNYIANESLGIATSTGYVKHSFTRSIHFGRVYTSGQSGSKGKEADLCEALRCLGQGLHCLEDFGAHTNYTELALREIGFRNVFTHTGTATEINLRGHRVLPLVTGTFGAVDFLHSVLGEATDHFAQSEVEELDLALGDAQAQSQKSSGGSDRGFGGPGQQVSYFTNLLSQVPGAGSLCQQAEQLQAQSDAEQQENVAVGTRNIGDSYEYSRAAQPGFQGPPGAEGGPPGPGIPGMSPNFDPIKTAAKIYPILEFRDKVVKLIAATIEKIPGLEALVEKITETLTLFVLSLLAPFIRPIIAAVEKQLKNGSMGVVNASGNHQYEPWTDPHCSDPTHSLLSKDHFSNILNEPAGQVASAILQYVAPRVIYAWQNPGVPVDEVLNDIIRVFHHPAIRDPHCEIHRNMYQVVERWAHSRPDRGSSLNDLLSSESVKAGKNHQGENSSTTAHSHGAGLPGLPTNLLGSGSHSKVSNGPWAKLAQLRANSGVGREADFASSAQVMSDAFPGTETAYDATRPPTGPAMEFSQPQQQQQPQPPYSQNASSYSQPPNFYPQAPYQQEQPYGDGSYQQGYAPGPPAPGEPYPSRGYSQGDPPYGYGYGYDPNAPPPGQGPSPGPYGYDPNAPPPAPYGYGGPPPSQGGYYGGAPY